MTTNTSFASDACGLDYDHDTPEPTPDQPGVLGEVAVDCRTCGRTVWVPKP